MRTTIARVVALFCLLYPVVGLADEETSLERLEQLVAKVKHSLPPGWTVEFTLADPNAPGRRGSHPAIVVKSADPLPVEHIYPGMPASDEPIPLPRIVQEVVALRFVVVEFMPPKSHASARNSNSTLREKRLLFQREHLRGISFAHKGPRPFPPSAFNARTEEETRLVKQYALLWVSTKLRPLPTHYANDHSFVMYLPYWLKIHDAKRSDEYYQIVEDIQEILVPYDKEPGA